MGQRKKRMRAESNAENLSASLHMAKEPPKTVFAVHKMQRRSSGCINTSARVSTTNPMGPAPGPDNDYKSSKNRYIRAGWGQKSILSASLYVCQCSIHRLFRHLHSPQPPASLQAKAAGREEQEGLCAFHKILRSQSGPLQQALYPGLLG